MKTDFLSGLEPSEVFHIFCEICAIPHGSGNTAALCDYCENAAVQKGLRTRRDKAGNLVILKNGTAGFENHPPVILQGHLDMVCEKTAEKAKDFIADGLDLRCEGDFLFADGTTLGGDDGIAVAMILALLLSSDIPHPPLEAVFTTDEEIGMLGASAFDASSLTGKTMINLDSEEEDTFWVSCAGGIRVDVRLPLKRIIPEERAVFITVKGLAGGHSGTEINKGRANAVRLLAELLDYLNRRTNIALISLKGGSADNVIPTEASAAVFTEDYETFCSLLTAFLGGMKMKYADSDPALAIEADDLGVITAAALRDGTLRDILDFIRTAPNGVIAESSLAKGLPETSLNLGIAVLHESHLRLSFLIRSFTDEGKNALAAKIAALAARYDGTADFTGDYPAWEYRSDSPLQAKMAAVYRRLYGREPIIKAVHAGLECGIFYQKISGLDCVSFGPDIFGIHTVDERLSLSSVGRVWIFLKTVLSEL